MESSAIVIKLWFNYCIADREVVIWFYNYSMWNQLTDPAANDMR